MFTFQTGDPFVFTRLGVCKLSLLGQDVALDHKSEQFRLSNRLKVLMRRRELVRDGLSHFGNRKRMKPARKRLRTRPSDRVCELSRVFRAENARLLHRAQIQGGEQSFESTFPFQNKKIERICHKSVLHQRLSHNAAQPLQV